MTTPTLTVYQERSAASSTGYQILTRIDMATGMPKEIFVHHATDDSYSHVAALDDFYWPTVKTMGQDFYRKDSCTVVYADVREAVDFAAYTKSRIDGLRLAFVAEVLTFLGSETTNLV